MGNERERNRVRSSIDDLPDEARQLLDERLADIRNTYQDIAFEMQGLGYEISRSAIGRYAMRHNGAAKRLKQAQEQTAALLQVVKSNQDVEATELAAALMIDGLTRRIATAEEDFESLPIDKAGRLLVQLQRTSVYKTRMLSQRKQACRDVEANIIQRMRELIQDDAALLSGLEQAVKQEASKDVDI